MPHWASPEAAEGRKQTPPYSRTVAGSAVPTSSSWEPQRAQEATRRGQVWGCAQGLAEAGSEKALGHGRSPALNRWGTSDQAHDTAFPNTTRKLGGRSVS